MCPLFKCLTASYRNADVERDNRVKIAIIPIPETVSHPTSVAVLRSTLSPTHCVNLVGKLPRVGFITVLGTADYSNRVTSS